MLDFQDSEVSSAELHDQQFIIRFSAAHVHQVNKQGDVDEFGFLQALELTIDHPTIIEKESGYVGRVSQGVLRVEDTTIKHIPIPYEATADVELELVFANGSVCRVTGKRVEFKSTSEARVVEWLKC